MKQREGTPTLPPDPDPTLPDPAPPSATSTSSASLPSSTHLASLPPPRPPPHPHPNQPITCSPPAAMVPVAGFAAPLLDSLSPLLHVHARAQAWNRLRRPLPCWLCLARRGDRRHQALAPYWGRASSVVAVAQWWPSLKQRHPSPLDAHRPWQPWSQGLAPHGVSVASGGLH